MSKTSQQAKVKTPLHLRLTPADWEECCKMLNYAEMKVFIWIRASDPYGVRELKFTCSKLGEKLGLHKSSVSRALKSLDTKQLIEIDFEDVRVTQKVSNRRLTLLCKEDNKSKQEQEEENGSVAPTQLPLHPRNVGCADATQVAPMQRQVRECNDQPPEPLPQADSKTPHTIQTYSDFSNTTTDSVAAADESFIEEEEKKKPTPEEFKEALQEIRRISPEIQINAQVRKAISLYWTNVPAAVAHTKKAVQEGWKVKSLTAILMKALKDPPEDAQSAAIATKQLPLPSKEQQIELDRLGKPAAVLMPDGLIAAGVDLGQGEILPWWRALKIAFEDIQ